MLIIEAICRGDGREKFSKIVNYVQDRVTCDKHSLRQRVYYYLKKLVGLGILVKVSEGLYELPNITPYCLIGSGFKRFSYVGGLGKRYSRETPEPIIALNKLHRELRRFYGDYEIFQKGFKFITIDSDTLADIDRMRGYLSQIVSDLKRNSIPIIDCTSLTKIYTIIAIEIASKNYLPVIYIYENTGRLY